MGNFVRVRRGAVALALGAGLAFVPGEPAVAADAAAVSIVNFRYLPPNPRVAEGDSLSVTNFDGTTSHNIRSFTDNPVTGQPWFRSPTARFPVPMDIAGVLSTPPGTYPFHCETHPWMYGTLTIT